MPDLPAIFYVTLVLPCFACLVLIFGGSIEGSQLAELCILVGD